MRHGRTPANEDPRHFGERVKRTIRECLQADGTPLVVAHGTFAHVLIDALGFKDRRVDNCVIYRISPVGDGAWPVETCS